MESPIMKTWRKIKTFGKKSSSTTVSFTRSKTWNGSAHLEDAMNMEPLGKIKKKCFTVYVGPTKQRIVVKTKLLNHPLFKNLLEAAENEYGYRRDGPIVLPCEVDFFFNVLADIKSDVHGDDYDEDDDDLISPPICGFGSPSVRRNGSYKLLRSPSLFKLNRF
ncbi:hypothetical protein HA466_0284810 [Hirschfeldia incana]|nr:hypothetical protein HA466_0284810 [Hirschfeldia incana]